MATLAIGPDNGGAGTEIDLSLFAGQAFHSAKRDGPIFSQAFDKSANTVVAALKSMLIPEVLVDSLAGKPALQLVFNLMAIGFTSTLRAGFWAVPILGPEGRVGRF